MRRFGAWLLWRRAAGMLGKMRWIGVSFICVEFGFHFKAP